MDPAKFSDQAAGLAYEAQELAGKAQQLAGEATQLAIDQAAQAAQAQAAVGDPFLFLFSVFVLACFIGFYVVWSVTPALHSPLMSVTNAISSVIIVGGLLAVGPPDGPAGGMLGGMDFSKLMGFLAVALASVNIFGGFIVTQRMLAMFKKKKK